MSRRKQGPDPAEDDTAPRTRRRRVRVVVAVSVLVLAGTGVAVAAPWHSGGAQVRSDPEPSAKTVKVVRTDLTDSQDMDGTLGYGTARTVRGAGDGTVTWLAPTGSTVSRGKTLYRADDRPVTLFYGDVPMYRRLATPNTVGRDVRVIADNLKALGYSIGSQPSPGQTVTMTVPAPDQGADAAKSGDTQATPADPSPSSTPSASASAGTGRGGGTGTTGTGTSAGTGTGTNPGTGTGTGTTTKQVKVESGDGVFTDSLIHAVKKWQTATGLPATGVIETGDVVVLSGAVRVASAAVQVGDPADAALLQVTPTVKVVTVEADATEVGTVQRGDPVTVDLPDGAAVAGKVAAIGTTAQSSESQGGDSALKVVVTVTLTDIAKAKKFDSAQVQVEFTAETRTGVLAVPVTALLALREGGYGLQLADGRLAAVRTGLFAGGMVEVSGNGIAEGVRVVTAS